MLDGVKFNSSIAAALGAALLFGASTPFAKDLGRSVSPTLLAGLLYLGSGAGLWTLRLIRDRKIRSPDMEHGGWPWFLGAVTSGGVAGPGLLMWGLTQVAASDASLLLNLEAVLTAIVAWIVFHENADRRVVVGMGLIVAGGAVLAWDPGGASSSGSSSLGVLAICGACLCWAIDNNLTRKVSASDAMFIAGTKGLVAGTTNLAIALLLGASLPRGHIIARSLVVGFWGYGVSLILFVLALRGLGSARTGAYFSTAPFIGAAIAITVFGEAAASGFWAASALMACGVWLHLTEQHDHVHAHELLVHSHSHIHDEHHQHSHGFSWVGSGPHTHEHTHKPLVHAHPHYPDIHHRHEH